MVKQYEKSSWWIVYRKKGNNVEILLLEWVNSRQKKEFVLPKWKIEEGEIAKETAIREISEETGLYEKDLEVIKFISKLSYTFTAWHLKDNPLIEKDVYLFLVKYKGEKNPYVRKEERFTGYKWFGLEEAKKVDVKFDITGLINKNKVYFI